MNIVYQIENGKRIIKEFDINNKLDFEGEFLYGQKNGKGKDYYNNEELSFEGEFANSKYKKGKRYDDGKL